MKKRNILITAALAGVLSLGACGKTDLKPLAEQVEVELGGSLDENVTSYASLDEKAAKEATLDLSAVDTNKTGTYPASVTYQDQKVAFEVVVKDTTAPEVEIADNVTVAVGMPLYAKDVIAEVTELSGEVIAVFEEVEPEEIELLEGTEQVEQTEQLKSTEAVIEETEAVTEPETFMVGDVICANDFVSFAEMGAYDVLLTVADASGNQTELKVSVIVGEAPEFSGVEDMTVTVGSESVDYLEGVTAKDYKGNDITDKIMCDAATVNLDMAGTYEILYTVADEEGFDAERKASVTVTDKKATTNSGKKTTEKNTANTGNAGTTNQPSGNTGNSGNATGGNTGNMGNGGNSGATNNNAGNTNPPSGNTGNSGNNGGTTTPPSENNGNSGNTNPPSGNTGNSGNNGGTTTPPSENNGNSGNTNPPSGNTGNSGNNGGTTTPPSENNGGNAGNTGMSVPEDFQDDFAGMDVGGADDGTGLGGNWEWSN